GKFPQRFHHALGGTAGPRVGDQAGVIKRELLAIILHEPWLVVVGIDVADAALHEQEDHPLRPGGKVRGLGRDRVLGRCPAGRQSGQRQRTEPAAGGGQPFAATDGEAHRGGPRFGWVSSRSGNRRTRRARETASPTPPSGPARAGIWRPPSVPRLSARG